MMLLIERQEAVSKIFRLSWGKDTIINSYNFLLIAIRYSEI